jgi:hypothetical protein
MEHIPLTSPPHLPLRAAMRRAKLGPDTRRC